KLMQKFLINEGFDVESFSTWADADMAINSQHIALVITGLTLADISGEAFIQRLLNSYTGPIIIMSASVNPDEEATFRARGIQATIPKSGAWKLALQPYLARLR
ncbi:MAG: response regulator, partial [Treponema sp.]|nr:response regulator [Treponema sp.]